MLLNIHRVMSRHRCQKTEPKCGSFYCLSIKILPNLCEFPLLATKLKILKSFLQAPGFILLAQASMENFDHHPKENLVALSTCSLRTVGKRILQWHLHSERSRLNTPPENKTKQKKIRNYDLPYLVCSEENENAPEMLCRTKQKFTNATQKTGKHTGWIHNVTYC